MNINKTFESAKQYSALNGGAPVYSPVAAASQEESDGSTSCTVSFDENLDRNSGPDNERPSLHVYE